MNGADTLFVLVCAAMVLFMTPGVAVLYAGLGRKKCGVDINNQVWICIGIVMVLWVAFGFSMAFGADVLGGVIGGGDFLFLNGVGIDPSDSFAPTVPFLAFFLLQVAFAIITPSLVAGGVAERINYKAYVLFVIVWSIIVYIPVCHMVWGGGLLAKMGLLDYAGGTVVHISAGFSSLAAALVVGARKNQDSTPHNMNAVSAGMGIVLFGWLFFNGSGAGAVDSVAVYSMTNTLISTATGICTWVIIDAIRSKHPSFMAVIMGSLGGLVGVTPGAAYITPMAAFFTGIIITIICYIAVNNRPKTGIDDTLDVWGIHGIGGFFGTILVGITANPDLVDLKFSMGKQLAIQLGCVIVVAAMSFIFTFVMFKIFGAFCPLRVSEEAESNVDEAIYGEEMYKL